jgi:hypothetical protein
MVTIQIVLIHKHRKHAVFAVESSYDMKGCPPVAIRPATLSAEATFDMAASYRLPVFDSHAVYHKANQ